ncbi:hypothetical protein HMPREF9163_02396 [Selenomonas sp. oral taxon 138 str. F0429]|nr:hypothetical protein HMPREF9163_02396 [Selenomonas sp. oral taxon 138 str. F0429]
MSPYKCPDFIIPLLQNFRQDTKKSRNTAALSTGIVKRVPE